MAKFEPFGFNDDFLPDSIKVDCPVCGETINIPFERESNYIVCPHCKSNIEIEST